MIIFISCAKKKRNIKCKAKDMYISDLFKKSLAYAQTLNPSKIYILSAFYGLLELDDEIEPYEYTLVNLPIRDLKKWAFKVYKQMKSKKICFDEEAIFLCSYPYRRFLIPLFKKANAPLKNMLIGNQLSFYKNHINIRSRE